MEEIKVQKTYAEFKNALDTEFNTAAESFNRIGYLLKVARDTDILAESGYSTVAEFAEAEYGLRKDDVSRFIAINDRYSEGGYSEQLAERYKGYGRAKLQEMLSLPQSIVDAIPLTTTKASIQEIKKEYKEEQAITDIEVMLEDKNESQEIMSSNLEKILHQLMHDNKELFEKIFSNHEKENVYDTLAPTGVATHIARLAAVGRFMLTLTDINDKMILLDMRTGEKEEYSVDDAVAAVSHILANTGKNANEAYKNLYGEPLEEENTVVKKSQSEKKIEKESTEKTKVEPVQLEENVEVDVVEESEAQTEENVEADVIETPETQTPPDIDLKEVAQSFYQYFMERIDYPATTLQRELHDIAGLNGVIIKIDDRYMLIAAGTAFEIKDRDQTVKEITIDMMLQMLEQMNTQADMEIDAIMENMRNSVKSDDWAGVIDCAQTIISIAQNMIKEESNDE